MRRSRTTVALLGMVVAAALVAAPLAHADHHEMKIREFFPGTTANLRDDAFLELQMYAAGQNVVGGQGVDLYANGADPSPDHYVLSAGSVANGESQRTVLIGGSLVPGTDKNEDIGASYDSAGGALCFVSTTFGTIDCVEWGVGNNSVNAGSPVSPGGITAGKSVTRTIAPGCPTLLEASDDTGDSATDFAESDPSPRNNAAAITEMPCAAAGGGGTVTPTPTANLPGFDLQAAVKRCRKKFPKGPKRKRCIRKAKQHAQQA